MTKECPLKRLCLTKNDCKRRYNEDMDEARGEKFIGPIARFIYYYERVL